MLGAKAVFPCLYQRSVVKSLSKPLVVCALVALALVVSISIAAAQAYPNIGNSAGHFSKASKASEAGIEGAGEVETANQPVQLCDPLSVSVPVPIRRVFLQKLPRALRALHFRPPPTVHS